MSTPNRTSNKRSSLRQRPTRRAPEQGADQKLSWFIDSSGVARKCIVADHTTHVLPALLQQNCRWSLLALHVCLLANTREPTNGFSFNLIRGSFDIIYWQILILGILRAFLLASRILKIRFYIQHALSVSRAFFEVIGEKMHFRLRYPIS